MRKEDIPFKNYDHGQKMAQGFHFTIDRDGHWYCHDPAMGTGPIRNEKISRLFSGAAPGKYAGKGLSRDGQGRFWLKAPPNDVYGVEVEDVPFVVTDFENNDGALVLKTNFGEDIVMGPDRTFDIRDGIPYVEVRGGLYARLGRSVFYRFVDMAKMSGDALEIEAGGMRHKLGSWN